MRDPEMDLKAPHSWCMLCSFPCGPKDFSGKDCHRAQALTKGQLPPSEIPDELHGVWYTLEEFLRVTAILGGKPYTYNTHFGYRRAATEAALRLLEVPSIVVETSVNGHFVSLIVDDVNKSCQVRVELPDLPIGHLITQRIGSEARFDGLAILSY